MANNKFTKRIAAAAGSLAGIAAAPAVGEAAVIHVSGSPVSLATSASHLASVTWDIDGDSVSDFRLWNNDGTIFLASNIGQIGTGTGPTFYGGTYTYAIIGRGNGRGIVAPFSTDNVLAQVNSNRVGPGDIFGFYFGSAQDGYYGYRNAMSSGGGIGYDFNYGFSSGDNFVGFRFDDGVGGGLNYGYAVFNFDTTNGIVTISEWWYETTDDASIHVGGVVPEPGSLALLAAGAAGLLAYRARRKPVAAGETPADETV